MTYLATGVVGVSIVSGYYSNQQAVASATETAAASLEIALINAGVSEKNAILQAETALKGTAMQTAAAIETALINAGVSTENAKLQAKTFMDSAEMKALGGELAVAEASTQFDNIQTLLAPTILAGQTAFTAQQALTGLGGEDAQREAIAKIEQSPEFQATTRQGEEAILSKASATGGLRGGNVQGALAQFRPAVLSNLIEKQFAKLTGISEAGQTAATTLTGAGLSTANTIANILSTTGVPSSALPADPAAEVPPTAAPAPVVTTAPVTETIPVTAAPADVPEGTPTGSLFDPLPVTDLTTGEPVTPTPATPTGEPVAPTGSLFDPLNVTQL